MGRDIRVEVICEDPAQRAVAVALLESLGVDRRRIDVRVAPRGQGAASAWVTRRYPALLERARRVRNHQGRLGFLVVIDGDNRGFCGRIQELDAAAGSTRQPDERVAILVPSWSIETWVLWLGCEDVTETQSLKTRVRQPEVIARAPAAARAWASPKPKEAIQMPSLTAARDELERLPMA